MATIEFLGGEETGNVGRLQWGNYVFEINKAVECSDPHIVAKARSNRFFKVDGGAVVDTPAPHPLDHDSDGRKGGSVARLDPLAKARAAKAAKREAEKGDAA